MSFLIWFSWFLNSSHLYLVFISHNVFLLQDARNPKDMFPAVLHRNEDRMRELDSFAQNWKSWVELIADNSSNNSRTALLHSSSFGTPFSARLRAQNYMERPQGSASRIWVHPGSTKHSQHLCLHFLLVIPAFSEVLQLCGNKLLNSRDSNDNDLDMHWLSLSGKLRGSALIADKSHLLFWN